MCKELGISSSGNRFSLATLMFVVTSCCIGLMCFRLFGVRGLVALGAAAVYWRESYYGHRNRVVRLAALVALVSVLLK